MSRKVVRPTSVAIIGGGIGGLVAALTLLRAGFSVTVYEQAISLSEVGAGIVLPPNCTRILGRLGLTQAIERVAVSSKAFEFRRWDDASLVSATPLGEIIARSFKSGFYQIHRADLLSLLIDALPTGTVQVARRCVDISDEGEQIDVRFDDGTEESASIVVGADGIHSKVREVIFGADSPQFTGNVAFRGLVPAERLLHLKLDRVTTLWMGPGGHLMQYFVASGRLLNVVFLHEEATWLRESWTDRGEIEELRTAFAGWNQTVKEIIDALDVTLKWALFDRPPLSRWSAGRITLLGDACHPMLPYMGQGAAQAIEDAAALAACLAAAHVDDAPAALRQYEKLRVPRATAVQSMSRANAGRFHLRDGPEQRDRDRTMAASIGLTPSINWLYGYDAEDIEQEVTLP